MSKPYLLFFVFVLTACQPDWKLNPNKVKDELILVQNEHTENQVIIETRLGDIHIELDKRTPLHRINFIRLVKMGYFNDRYFYRNIYDSGIQGGGEYFDRLDYLVPAEYIDDLKPIRGTIAMARYDEGNPEKASSPTEFFIISNTEEAKPYYKNYVVFGKVTKGMDVVDAIKNERSFDEKPVNPVKFTMKAE
jgi:cyclophilin family peptidyl-prolyl cis-trans isomerase